MTKFRVIIYRANVIRPACNHLLGKNHTKTHRIFIGVGAMIVGVAIAKTLGHSAYVIIEYLGDTVGYGLHGIGLTPIIEAMLDSAE